MRFITLLVLLFLGHLMCGQAPFSFTVVNLSGTASLTCNKTSLDFSVTVSGDTPSLVCVWQGPFAIQGFSASLVTVGIYTVSVSSGTTTVQQTVAVYDGRNYPVISASNGPFTISCPSGTVDLIASVAGNDPINFAWYHNTQIPAVGSGSVFTAAAAGQYAVVAVNQINGCAATLFFDVWACTSTIEQRPIKARKIFPNPVRDQFWLQSEVPEGTLVLSDLSGKVVRTWQTGQDKFLTGDCPDGIYCLRLESGGSVSWVTLVILKK